MAKKEELNKKKEKKQEKKSLWIRFRTFCSGVKSEFDKVHWTSKSKMIKYSIATIIFIIFCALFFYAIDIIFAWIQSLIK
jgi:preprotein translocase SecE subunit